MSCDFNVSAYARVSLSYPPWARGDGRWKGGGDFSSADGPRGIDFSAVDDPGGPVFLQRTFRGDRFYCGPIFVCRLEGVVIFVAHAHN